MNAVDKYHWKQYNRIAKRAGLKTLRFDEWDESLHERDENGKFTSTGGSNSAKPEKESKENTPETKNSSFEPFTHKDVTSYLQALAEAKKSLPEGKGAWRVDCPSEADFKENHPDAKMHITEYGSTIAVDKYGDICAVCAKYGDTVRGRDLIKMAVENGGTKLDSYDGNFGFYVKCGFEPKTWCMWSDKYTPDDWKAGRDNPEDVIFFEYTGKPPKYKSMEEFKNAVKPSKDYYEAFAERDRQMEGK